MREGMLRNDHPGGRAHLGVAEDGGDVEASGTFHVHEEAGNERSMCKRVQTKRVIKTIVMYMSSEDQRREATRPLANEVPEIPRASRLLLLYVLSGSIVCSA